MSNWFRLAALALVVGFGLSTSAAHATVIFNIDSVTNGDSPNKIDPTKPFVIISINNAGTDLVSIEIDATNLASQNFLPFVLLNYIGNATELGNRFPPQGVFATFSSSQDLEGGDQVKAGLFNVQLGFNTAENSDRLSGGETTTWVLAGAGLDETDFLLTSLDKPAPNPSLGGWYAAIRVQGIQLEGGREGSGSIGGNTAIVTTVVPEPGSAVLLGLGGLSLTGLAWARRRRAAA